MFITFTYDQYAFEWQLLRTILITGDIIVELATPGPQVLLQYLSVLAGAPEMRRLDVSVSTAQRVPRIDALALRVRVPIRARAAYRTPGELVVVPVRGVER